MHSCVLNVLNSKIGKRKVMDRVIASRHWIHDGFVRGALMMAFKIYSI